MSTEQATTRPPVIAIMGHIDHGKSTLLSYIRKSKTELHEAGGITQHISAYEVVHTGSDGVPHPITFLDTPGHEAFSGIRKRGAGAADIAVLVVSAEDGVKPQTLEAVKSIRDSHTPFIVAITKIDKPDANVDYAKQTLTEKEIYLEGYGGDVPVVSVSAKTGEGVADLLDMILLLAEVSTFTGTHDAPGEGVVIESSRDARKGIGATCIIKNGTVRKGEFIVAGNAIAPIRIMENYTGTMLETATFSSPVRIIGWDILPPVGVPFITVPSRKDAEELAQQYTDTSGAEEKVSAEILVPIIVKADAGGSLEAVMQEIKKLARPEVAADIVSSGIGLVSERDIQGALGGSGATIIAFSTKVDTLAKNLAERNGIEIHSFDIIYKMSEWLESFLASKIPKTTVAESVGRARIIKVFSKTKDKQIVGGSVEDGILKLGAQVKITRRDAEIGVGKIRELQSQKNRTEEVGEGREFGAMIEAKVEIAAGDRVESFILIEK